MPKVSVIVPIFGVVQYIERCARSLFEQTFDDVEFIFVDDCTKDNSIGVLEKVMKDYPQRKDSITILHHEINKGLPQARKTGMLAASGDYIINFDSDDWVDKTVVQSMYNRATSENADIVICDYYTTNGEVHRLVKGCYHTEKTQLIKDLCRMRISWSVCNKLFKRSLLDENTVFPEGNMGEDMGLMLPLVLKSSVFAYEPKPYYYYYNNPQSITHEIGVEQKLRRHEMLRQNTEIVLKAFDRYNLTKKYRGSVVAIKWNAKKILWDLVFEKKYFKMWVNTYSEINFIMLFDNQILFSEKIKYLMTYLRLYPQKRS